MRAVSFTEFGGPEVLEIADIPTPEPGPGQVRIEVRAATVNPVDLNIRLGRYSFLPELERYGLGWDVAGTIDALGDGVTGFTAGDAVLGMSHYFTTLAGAQAEYLVLDATEITRIPGGIDFIGAATLPLNSLTAAQGLTHLGLTEGQTLAITGAAGAVGGFATKLAVRAGLRVFAVAGARDAEFVEQLGATFVPRSDDVAAAVRAIVPDGVDGVYDPALIGAKAVHAVRDNGVFVNVSRMFLPDGERGVRTEGMVVQGDGQQLGELAVLAQQGELAIRVAETLPLADVTKAHDLLAQGGIRGRVVLVP